MRLRRQGVLAALVLVGVFVLGAVAGVIGAAVHAHHHLRSVFRGTPEEVDTRVTLALLDTALRLTDDERRRVREILDQNAPEHSRLRAIIEPDLGKLRAKEREEVRAVLSPERRESFDSAMALLDERRARLDRLLDH